MKNIYRTLHILFSSLFKTFLLFFRNSSVISSKMFRYDFIHIVKKIGLSWRLYVVLKWWSIQKLWVFLLSWCRNQLKLSPIVLFGCYCSWISLAKLINLGLVFIFMYFSILFHYIWHMYHSQACKCSVWFDLEIKSIPTFT